MPDLDLPYDYNENTRSGGLVFRVALVVATIALAVLFYFSIVPMWAIFAPFTIFAIRVFLYTLIRNAVHEATRMADVDSHLDGIVMDQIAEQKRVGLTPGFLNSKLLETAE